MRHVYGRLLVGCAALLLVFAPFLSRAAQAQDAGMKHVCDSTLIALLYVAESNGYHSMMDTSTFEKGAWQPLFDAMMASMSSDDSMMQPTEAMMATDDMMQPTEAMMAPPTEDSMMMALDPGMVSGEDSACTQLRTDVEAYLYRHYSDEMMMR
jgi:hypothetical protein